MRVENRVIMLQYAAFLSLLFPLIVSLPASIHLLPRSRPPLPFLPVSSSLKICILPLFFPLCFFSFPSYLALSLATLYLFMSSTSLPATTSSPPSISSSIPLCSWGRKMVSCRDHCNPILIPPISCGDRASERHWKTNSGKETWRREVFWGEIISTPCTVYPLQSISSLPFLLFHVEPQHLSLSLCLSELFHSYLFLSPSLSFCFTHFWYSRHAAFSRWSNSFAAATSHPLSPRQPSISYWCASKRDGWRKVGMGRGVWCEVLQVEQGAGWSPWMEVTSINIHMYFNPYEVFILIKFIYIYLSVWEKRSSPRFPTAS